MKTAVLYHNDADGFGAAYAVWKAADTDETILFLPVQYGEPFPELPESVEELFIVDFSYDRDLCIALADKYKLLILDHHKTAQTALQDLPFARFDMSKSGAILAWEHFFGPDTDYFEPIPSILQYVQDRDLWRFNLPYSEEVNLYISTLQKDFSAWDAFNLDEAIASGIAIKRFRDSQVAKAIKSNVRFEDVAGYRVPVLNLTENVSEVGNELCKQFPEAAFSISYSDRRDGLRSYSLRSIGEFDVSAIAKQFGGGGHRNAAGFTTPMPVAAMERAA